MMNHRRDDDKFHSMPVFYQYIWALYWSVTTVRVLWTLKKKILQSKMKILQWFFLENHDFFAWKWWFFLRQITTIGFGDITPLLQCEIIFTIFAEMFGMAFFGAILHSKWWISHSKWWICSIQNDGRHVALALLVDHVVRLSDVRFCIKSDDFLSKNDEFCTKNDEFLRW